MTTRKVTDRICDGCGKSALFDGIQIYQSRPKYEWSDIPDRTIDLCEECAIDQTAISAICVTRSIATKTHADSNSNIWPNWMSKCIQQPISMSRIYLLSE